MPETAPNPPDPTFGPDTTAERRAGKTRLVYDKTKKQIVKVTMPETAGPDDSPLTIRIRDGIAMPGQGTTPVPGALTADERELTAEEAKRAYDEAEPVPLSKERIDEIVDYATGKAALKEDTASAMGLL